MSDPIRVEVVRSGSVESIHLVDVAVVGDDGRVVARAGDPMRVAAFRSSAKPIQARVARALGWHPADAHALAIACASHSGERIHLEAVRAVLAHAGLSEQDLACPPTMPLDPAVAARAGRERRVQHNCSGKHAAMLAACVAGGLPIRGYLSPDHPLQSAIRDQIQDALGVNLGPPLVDGCGAPTFVAPMAAFASAFRGVDGHPEAAAMRAHPDLVGGTGRFDTDLMRTVPSLCVKGGAEALCCITDGTMGIALKVRDGGARAVPPAALHVLYALGLIDPDAVAHHARPAVLGGGERVGELVAMGDLSA